MFIHLLQHVPSPRHIWIPITSRERSNSVAVVIAQYLIFWATQVFLLPEDLEHAAGLCAVVWFDFGLAFPFAHLSRLLNCLSVSDLSLLVAISRRFLLSVVYRSAVTARALLLGCLTILIVHAQARHHFNDLVKVVGASMVYSILVVVRRSLVTFKFRTTARHFVLNVL